VAANPIELNYPVTGRNVCCIRVSIDPATGASAKVYNTNTQLYETYTAAHDSLYQINLTEVIPNYYRAACPAGSITTPATELFFDMKGDTTLNILNHAPSIGQGNSQGVNIGTINGSITSVGVNPSAVVDICNLALTHIGQKNITSLSDATENARRCLQIYANCRDEVLRDAAWKFATVIATLVENDVVTVVGWDYVYDLPADYVRIRKIYTDDTTLFDTMISNSAMFVNTIPVTNPRGIPYKIVYDVDTAAQVLVSNANPLYIEYTVRINNPSFYDAMFIKALSFKLASELANYLCTDSNESDKMLQRYAMIMSEAARVNGDEDGIPLEKRSTTWDVR
jgi:hypothetical protein